ncbi:MAG TPA: MarR family transcriptional regulator [Pseudonocardiaceae bacterium]|jgi:DNA-binding MarR family transcriptional regulator|nr:MarR family transcriptional regulator [Pseudonocardiaceae bacterium]
MTTTPSADAARTALALSTTLGRLRSRLRLEGGVFQTGLTITQLSTLQRIIDNGPMTGAALATAEHIRPQSMWELIAVLVKEGLVERQPDQGDRRKILIAATGAGEKLVADVLTSRTAWLTRTLAERLDDQERQVLVTATELLNRLVED